jgi:hypothetical protein
VVSVPPQQLEGELQLEAVSKFIASWMEAVGLTARDAVNVIDMLSTFVAMWERHYDIELAVLIPEILKRIFRIDARLGYLDKLPMKLQIDQISFHDVNSSLLEIYNAYTEKFRARFSELQYADSARTGLNQWIRVKLINESNHNSPESFSAITEYGDSLDMVSRLFTQACHRAIRHRRCWTTCVATRMQVSRVSQRHPGRQPHP